MRYAQGGGLTTEPRRLRERIRYEAGERFARGEETAVVARDLRVSERSVERWRRAGWDGGMAALASAGPPKLPRLSDGRFAELEKEPALGPAAHGWEDQRWSLARIGALIAWRFQIDCSMAAVCRLMHQHGWSWRCPACRADERDERAAGLWKMCGRRWNDRGGAGSLHRLRGRGRILDDAVRRPHLGLAWAHAGGVGARPVLAPLLDRRDVL
ncbi:winged helix-turn-helix domain-containing protein [Streptomyces sp. NPDC005811]|uniref:winged helix-turn-helix domain-containing protein n=1 Tax=Streptomyces sp. NPDC005811 TaxID=3154565 RepID=UPI0033ECC29E